MLFSICPSRAYCLMIANHSRHRLPLLSVCPLLYVLSPLPRWHQCVHMLLIPALTSIFPYIMEGRLPDWHFRGLLSVRCALGPHNRWPPIVAFSLNALAHSLPPELLQSTSGRSNSCREGFEPSEHTPLSRAHIIFLLSVCGVAWNKKKSIGMILKL